MYILSLFLLFNADPELKFVSPILSAPGQFISIRPSSTSGKVVKYVAIDPGLSVFPSNLLTDQSATVIVAQMPGRYRVLAYTAIGDIPSDPVMITLEISGNGPLPPVVPPKPGPDSTPDDPLTATISGIFGALTEPNKESNLKTLGSFYRQCAKLYKDPAFLNVGQVFTASRKLSESMLPNSVLRPVREKFGAELNMDFPADANSVLTDELRLKVAVKLERLAKVIDQVLAGG